MSAKLQALKTRVLIVDDSIDWRAFVRQLLQARDDFVVISEAGDGVEAIEKAADLHPDLVLLDIAMPHLNGLDAAKSIKRVAPDSRIVFLTQIADLEVMEAARAIGADWYVLKTEVSSKLLDTCADALKPPQTAWPIPIS